MERGCREEGGEQEDVRQMERGDSAEQERERERKEGGRFVFN